jgi:hypothetical protein
MKAASIPRNARLAFSCAVMGDFIVSFLISQFMLREPVLILTMTLLSVCSILDSQLWLCELHLFPGSAVLRWLARN